MHHFKKSQIKTVTAQPGSVENQEIKVQGLVLSSANYDYLVHYYV